MGGCINEAALEGELVESLKYACPDFELITEQQTARYVSNQLSRFDPAYFAELFKELCSIGAPGSAAFGDEVRTRLSPVLICFEHRRCQTERRSQSSKMASFRLERPESEAGSVNNSGENGHFLSALAMPVVPQQSAENCQKVKRLDLESAVRAITADLRVSEPFTECVAAFLGLHIAVKMRKFIQLAYVIYNTDLVRQFHPLIYFLFADEMFNMRPKTSRLNGVLEKAGNPLIDTKQKMVSAQQFREIYRGKRAFLENVDQMYEQEENQFIDTSHFTDISFERNRNALSARLVKLERRLGDGIIEDIYYKQTQLEVELDIGDDGFSDVLFARKSGCLEVL